ncbi:hypothetical protein SAMN05878503_103270 [Cereibacter ovatus]|uniref:Pilus assembly protein n=1 Tax=Cereibacter ovatus TaxID=439529 RepID=A0A285CP04_9RHOB|nr:hypothetical protein [Cereibacter ovatus]SNX69282.1 hypothetical protein SAMN05878503_103270 [Cereibacter ovatus]
MSLDLKRFLMQTDGAVTVDWVVLTAAIIALCLLVTIPYYTGASGATTELVALLLDAVNGVRPE